MWRVTLSPDTAPLMIPVSTTLIDPSSSVRYGTVMPVAEAPICVTVKRWRPLDHVPVSVCETGAGTGAGVASAVAIGVGAVGEAPHPAATRPASAATRIRANNVIPNRRTRRRFSREVAKVGLPTAALGAAEAKVG